jgi:HAMP domain-containing protein
MKITTRLVLSFLLAAVAPLALMGSIGLLAMSRVSQTAIDESAQALRQLGEAAIQQKSLDVARQVALYLSANPELLDQPLAEWLGRSDLADIAVQPVGQTGYTAVYDDQGIVYFHANAKMVGRDMHELAEQFPAFWAIYAASLDGTQEASYYDWQDADGSIRAKYMSCAPVGDTRFRVAATTYIDEFSQPMRETETRITMLSQTTLRSLLAALAVVGLLAAVLGLWLARGLSHPILAVAEAAANVESGHYEQVALGSVARRPDELGQLAQVFQRMAREVQQRQEHLEQQVATLRIEIDEVKKQRQVDEITETEYFHRLQEKVSWMKARAR